MADTIEGRDAAGWKSQWDAMKAENDRLNPALDAAKTKIGELQIKAAENASAIDALRSQLDVARKQLADTAEQRALGSVLSLAQQCQTALTDHLAKLKAGE